MSLRVAASLAQAACLLSVFAAAAESESQVDPSRVTGTFYVIRHGEKIKAGNHLNATGKGRAQHVARLFGKGEGSLYEPPKAIFANFYHNEYNSIELGTPLAEEMGIKVNSSYHRPLYGEDNFAAAAAMHKALVETGGPVMGIWESWNLVPLAMDLGCNHSWMAKYNGWAWEHAPGRKIDSYDRFFILHMREGKCERVDLKWEGFEAYKTWPGYVASEGEGYSTPITFMLVLGLLAVAFLVLLRVACWKRVTEKPITPPEVPYSPLLAA